LRGVTLAVSDQPGSLQLAGRHSDNRLHSLEQRCARWPLMALRPERCIEPDVEPALVIKTGEQDECEHDA
jgi:hypothetical protein